MTPKFVGAEISLESGAAAGTASIPATVLADLQTCIVISSHSLQCRSSWESMGVDGLGETEWQMMLLLHIILRFRPSSLGPADDIVEATCPKYQGL